MSFETFLDLLVKLSATLFPENDLKTACDQMIEKYFLPIYDVIMKETIAGDISSIVSKEVDLDELKPFIGVGPRIKF
jgi:hypothetical protein